MKENIRISSYVGIAFLVSFGMLFLFLTINEEGIFVNTQIQKNYSDEEKNVFLVGTSYVDAINTGHVQNILNENDMNVEVIYHNNVSFQQFEDTIDEVILNKNNIVVFGIGFNDLGLPASEDCIDPKLLEYTIKNTDILEIQLNTNQDNTIQNIFNNNPKHLTINILKNSFQTSPIFQINNSDVKKQKISDKFDQLQPITSIINLNKGDFHNYCLIIDKRDTELDSLNRSLAKLKLNDVDAIVFIPPYTKGYLDALSDEIKSDLINNVQAISKKYNYNFYDMSDKYENLNIFNDHTHVAKNPRSLIYSKDISSLILSNFAKESNQFDMSKDFLEQNLTGANLQHVNLSNKNLSNLDLSGAILYGANFTNTSLISTNMSNSQLMHVDLSGKDLTGTILIGSDLTGTILIKSNLTGANLSNVDLSGKDLTGANLSYVDLSKMDVRRVTLTNSYLEGANLSNVDLSGKDLTGVTLSGSNLSGANLSGANLTHVDFTGSNLENVKGAIFLSCVGYHLCN